ncbi:MAG: hypothetical protein R3C18_02910 [Planctomycetaceae bacterium]
MLCLLVGCAGVVVAQQESDSNGGVDSENGAPVQQVTQQLEALGYRVVPSENGVTSNERKPVDLEALLDTPAADLLDMAQKTSFATVNEAVYEATVLGEELRNGQLTCMVQHLGRHRSSLNWTETNLAIHSLFASLSSDNGLDRPTVSSETVPAVWGTSPDGRILVFIEDDQTKLTGRWSARGKTLGRKPSGNVESAETEFAFPSIQQFQLTFPPALNSQLRLRVPNSKRVKSPAGLLSGPEPAESGWSIWTLDLGRRRDVRIQIEPASMKGDAALYANLETAFSASPQGLNIQADAELISFASEARSIEVALPRQANVQDVTLNNVAIPFRVSGSNPVNLEVSVGELSAGQIGQLRIRANAPLTWGLARSLPKLRINDVIVLSERVTLVVEPPLEAESLVTKNMLQTALSTESVGEVWTFQSLRENSEITAKIQESSSQLSVESTTILSLQPELLTAVVQLDLLNRSGKTFSLECKLPQEWSVVDVAVGGRHRPTWVEQADGNDRRLRLELVEPIGGESPSSLFFTLRRPPPSPGDSWLFPAVQLKQTKEATGACYVVNSERFAIVVDGETFPDYEVNQSEIPQPLLQRLKSVSPQLPLLGESVALLRWRSPSPPPAVMSLTENPLRMTTNGDEFNSGSSSDSAESLPTVGVKDTASISAFDALSGTVQLDLSTVLTSMNGAHHVSRASYRFSRRRELSALRLSLPESCIVSSVIVDGRSVTVLRRGEQISFPQRADPAKTLEILYLIPATRAYLVEEVGIPLPLNGEPIDEIRWSVEGALGQRIEIVNSTDAIGVRPENVQLAGRLLGPLARSDRNGWFNPLRPQEWSTSGGSADSGQSALMVTVGRPGTLLRLRYWKTRQFRAIAWAVLLFCGLAGIAVRMWNWTRLRNLALVLLLGLGVAALLLPEEAAMIAGGGFVGSILSLLFPRRYVQCSDLIQSNADAASAPFNSLRSTRWSLGNWVALILVGVASVNCSGVVVAQAPVTDPPEVQLLLEGDAVVASTSPMLAELLQNVRDENPAYVISSIDYEVLESKPLSIRATVRVRMLDPGGAPYISLPFSGIVLRNGASCLVDGETTELIPSTSGDALLVPMPQDPAIRRHRIEMEFGLRPDAEADGVLLPPVMAATLRAPAEFSPQNFARHGMVREVEGEETLVFLGNVERLVRSQTNDSLPINAGELTADMQVRLDRRQASVKCNLNVKLAEQVASSVELLLPHGCRLQQIVSPELKSFDVVRSRRIGVWLHVELDQPIANLTLQYQVPIENAANGSLMVPPLLSSPLGNVHQALQLTPGTGTKITSVSPVGENIDAEGGVASASSDSWNLILDDPCSLHVNIDTVPIEATAKIIERLSVTREEAQYEGTVLLDSMRLPQFVHQLELSPDWYIQDVQVEQSGATRTVRWSREGSRMTVFVPDGVPDKRSLHIRGVRPVQTEVWENLPEIRVPGVTVGERQILVYDDTKWSVEVSTAGGTVMTTSARKNSDDGSGDGESEPAILSLSSTISPEQFRIVPGREAARSDSVTMLLSDEESQWTVIQQVHIEALEAKLRQVQMLVPPEIVPEMVVSPPSLRTSIVDEDSGFSRMTIDVPQRWRDELTFSISWTVSHDELLSKGLNECIVESAEEASQFIVLPVDAGLQVASRSGRSVSGASLPRWTPTRWTNLVRQRDALCYQVVAPTARFETQASDPTAGHIPWAEQVVWIHPDGTSHGELRLWGHCHENFALELVKDKETDIGEIESLSDSQIRVDMDSSDGVQTINVTDVGGVFDIIVYWHKNTPSNAVASAPHLRTVVPQRMLTTVVTTEQWQLVAPSEARPLSAVESCIVQWKGYMDCLDESINAIPVTSSILDRVREIRQELDELLAARSDAEVALFREHVGELEDRWRILQEKLPITIPESAPTVRQVWDNESTGRIEGQFVTRLVTNQPLSSLEFLPARKSPVDWRRVGFIALLFIAVVAKFQVSRRFPLREWFAVHPSLALATFGVVWWTWLSPSVLGFVIFLLGGVQYLLEHRAVESSRPNAGPGG